jgi:hypothetical protein
VLEILHRVTGLPIVADYYTRLHKPEAVTVRNQSLHDALNRLSDAMRLRWRKENGWLQFRSAGYFIDRVKEVPNRLLRRWAASRRTRGSLALEELIEIAQLSDPQLDAAEMAEGVQVLFGLAEWNLAANRSLRPHWRFLAGLTPAQRQAAVSAPGLSFPRLSISQQQQFIVLALGSQVDQLTSLEGLPGASLRVDYVLPGQFEWNPPRDPEAPFWRGLMPSPARDGTPERVLQAARRIDARAEAAQVVPSQMALTVIYTLGDPEFASPFVLRVNKDGNSSVRARIASRTSK